MRGEGKAGGNWTFRSARRAPKKKEREGAVNVITRGWGCEERETFLQLAPEKKERKWPKTDAAGSNRGCGKRKNAICANCHSELGGKGEELERRILFLNPFACSNPHVC